MKTSNLASILSLSSLWIATNAFPLLHFDQLVAKRAPQSYSVVPVDGGQPTGASVQTVTDRVVQTSITTILSTLILTQSNTITTVVVTSTAAVTITQAAPPVTVSAPAETRTMLVGGSMTSSPYDNGMWRTTYYSSWLVSSTALLPTPLSPSPHTSSTRIALSSQSTPAASAPSSFSPALSSPALSIPEPDAAIAVVTPTTSTASSSATVSVPAAAQTTNWATAYGQWHDRPNAVGSWWWR